MGVWGSFYLKGNYFDGTCPDLKSEYQSLLTSVNNDNWIGLQPNETETAPLPNGGKTAIQSNSEFTIGEDASEFTQSAKDAYNSVLKYTALEALKTNKIPILIINGTKDRIAPEFMAEKLYSNCKAPKTKVTFADAGHLKSYYADTGKYQASILDFIKQCET